MFDELNGEVIEMAEIITGMGDFPGLVSHPIYIFFNVFDELFILFDGVGVIESEVAFAFGNSGLHEIKSHCLTMTNVKIPIRFWWETSQNAFSKLFVPFL